MSTAGLPFYGFRPGLKARGHEAVLYPTTAELIAALPPPGGDLPGENAGAASVLDPDAVSDEATAREVVEAYLRARRLGGAS